MRCFFQKINKLCQEICVIMTIFYELFFIKKIITSFYEFMLVSKIELIMKYGLIILFCLWTLYYYCYYYYYYYYGILIQKYSILVTSEQNSKLWPIHVGEMTHYWDILPFRFYQYIKSDWLLFFDEQWLTPVMYYMKDILHDIW